MGRKFFTLILFALLLPHVLSAKEHLTDEQKLKSGWVLTEISYGEDPTIAILKVRAVIDTAPEKIWLLLKNIDDWKKWMPVLSRGFILNGDTVGRIGTNPVKDKALYDLVSASPQMVEEINGNPPETVFMFEEYDFPWPVSNDWVVSEYHFDSSRSGEGLYNVSWSQLFKGSEGRNGAWKLSRDGSVEKTLFEYDLGIKVKEGVPKMVFEMVIKMTTDRFIEAIKKNAV